MASRVLLRALAVRVAAPARLSALPIRCMHTPVLWSRAAPLIVRARRFTSTLAAGEDDDMSSTPETPYTPSPAGKLQPVVLQSSTLEGLSMMRTRTHSCGDLRSFHSGQDVVLCGWLHRTRNIGGGLQFCVLRDGVGSVQLMLSVERLAPELLAAVADLPLESSICVRGEVRMRPADMRNRTMSTGDVEVAVECVHLLNKSAQLPFPIEVDDVQAEQQEVARLTHRYLDLRRSTLQANLRFRSRILLRARNVMHALGFTEVETPTLFRSTPEGAREFLVPTRQPGQFYSLTQSPQQYKQLLMVGGIGKYYQIARCYRDEGMRADRQPEFTQLDIEMAYIGAPHIYQLVEHLLSEIWSEAGKLLTTPFPHMSYHEAISRFGSDKPDTRFGMELVDISKIFGSSNVVMAINANQLCRSNPKALQNFMQQLPADVVALEAKSGGELKLSAHSRSNAAARHIDVKAVGEQLRQALDVRHTDCVLMASAPVAERERLCLQLGQVRLASKALRVQQNLIEIPSTLFNALWVVDFPLFTRAPDTGALQSTHHPFTAPLPEDAPLLMSNDVSDVTAVRGLHYDCVVNGVELGGGSIRIHDAEMQRHIFERLLALPPAVVGSFEHLLRALSYGAPPHGGIALGVDRLLAVLCQSASIREVIAFPKTAAGNELMSGAPARATEEQLREYHIASSPATSTAAAARDSSIVADHAPSSS